MSENTEDDSRLPTPRVRALDPPYRLIHVHPKSPPDGIPNDQYIPGLWVFPGICLKQAVERGQGCTVLVRRVCTHAVGGKEESGSGERGTDGESSDA